MEYKMIKVEQRGRVVLLTHNRPEASNAFAYESYGEFRHAMETLGADPSVGAIVITGAGKHFSAGGDVVRFKTLIETGEFLNPDSIMYADQMAAAILRCPKPVIAMVNGAAAGAGLSCALSCDFRIVAPSSRFVMAFINLGLCGDTGSIYLLPKIVGLSEAKRMMMLGEPVLADRAMEIGLADIMAEEGKLEETAMAFAEKLANKSTAAIADQKAIINKYFFQDLDPYFVDEIDAMAKLARKPDFKEAVFAFLEKRAPKYNLPE